MTIPDRYHDSAERTAREQLGSGLVPDYYLQIAAEWEWMYYAGLQDGRSEQRLKQKASVLARRRNKGKP